MMKILIKMMNHLNPQIKVNLLNLKKIKFHLNIHLSTLINTKNIVNKILNLKSTFKMKLIKKYLKNHYNNKINKNHNNNKINKIIYNKIKQNNKKMKMFNKIKQNNKKMKMFNKKLYRKFKILTIKKMMQRLK